MAIGIERLAASRCRAEQGIVTRAEVCQNPTFKGPDGARVCLPFCLGGGREDGPINSRSFLAYVEQCPAPELSLGDVVITDNLGSHKSQAVRQAIRRTGAKLFFLPAYSPDLNPIEQVFAKLKTLLRTAARRTIEATSRQIGQLLDRFTPTECANYLANAGYASK